LPTDLKPTSVSCETVTPAVTLPRSNIFSALAWPLSSNFAPAARVVTTAHSSPVYVP